MKKAPIQRKNLKVSAEGDILAEYDFRGAERNKYASRYAAGSRVIVLEPDVAAFPSAAEANDALRTLAALIEKHRAKRPAWRAQEQFPSGSLYGWYFSPMAGNAAGRSVHSCRFAVNRETH